MSPDLFDFTPEQREVAQAFVDSMSASGVTLTVDEAQLAANLSAFAEHILAENPQLATKSTRVLAGKSATAYGCLAVIAQHVARQHTLVYDDVNLRALSTMSMVLAVLAVLTPQKFKHARGR